MLVKLIQLGSFSFSSLFHKYDDVFMSLQAIAKQFQCFDISIDCFVASLLAMTFVCIPIYET